MFVLTWYDVAYCKSEGGEDWDDSVLTKDEADARLRKKVEAVIKRERAMAYAYSHKVNNDPTSLLRLNLQIDFWIRVYPHSP